MTGNNDRLDQTYGIALEAMQSIAERKIAFYRGTIYDHALELRAMERVKDQAAVTGIKANLVKFEHIVDELEKALAEVKAEIGSAKEKG